MTASSLGPSKSRGEITQTCLFSYLTLAININMLFDRQQLMPEIHAFDTICAMAFQSSSLAELLRCFTPKGAMSALEQSLTVRHFLIIEFAQ